MSVENVEGHYRLISHNEKKEAIYARLAPAGGVTEWVRKWREATTFLTQESAQIARDAARLEDASRDISLTKRFYEWRTKGVKPKSGKAKKRAKAEAQAGAPANAPPPQSQDASPPAERDASGAST